MQAPAYGEIVPDPPSFGHLDIDTIIVAMQHRQGQRADGAS